MQHDPNLPSPGDVLAGKYRIERLIGRGGMGAVFAAEHLLLGQRVALKLLLGELADSPEATARFMNEARAAAQIRGEHVVRVLDIGQLPNSMPFMVLEYLEGADLSAIVHQRGALPVAEVADYALQALDALAQAHAAGIVHRDLKPANLFLARRHDGTSLVKVLDFGISKNLSPMASPHVMTKTRALLGSPEYMSPEQLRAPRSVDTRTDIWSFGVILYELLTGRVPFTGSSMAEVFHRIMETDPAPPRSLRPDLPAALEAVVLRCMARDAGARFATVQELAAVLMVFASDTTRAVAAARAPGHVPKGASEPVAETVQMEVSANTAATWAKTRGERPEGSRSRIVAVVGASVLGMLVGIIVVAMVIEHFFPPKPSDGMTNAAPAALDAAVASPAPMVPSSLAPPKRDAGPARAHPRP
jgi:serine/threonine-protein kinase